jgi:hypothetical protein
MIVKIRLPIGPDKAVLAAKAAGPQLGPGIESTWPKGLGAVHLSP